MIQEHPSFPQPHDPRASIWRYMGLAKFTRLLQTRRLYFARADCLGDPFEGSNTAAASRVLDQAIQPGNEDKLKLIYPSMSPEAARSAIGTLKLMRVGMRTQAFISCWHMADEESAAMWTLYGGQDASVAIRASYEALAKALPTGSLMGLVRYLHWDQDMFDQGNMLAQFMHKRASYKHEREIRALIDRDTWDWYNPNTPLDPNQLGLEIPIDLAEVVEGVYVSPSAPRWFEEVVQGICDSCGLALTVRQSELSSAVMF